MFHRDRLAANVLLPFYLPRYHSTEVLTTPDRTTGPFTVASGALDTGPVVKRPLPLLKLEHVSLIVRFSPHSFSPHRLRVAVPSVGHGLVDSWQSFCCGFCCNCSCTRSMSAVPLANLASALRPQGCCLTRHPGLADWQGAFDVWAHGRFDWTDNWTVEKPIQSNQPNLSVPAHTITCHSCDCRTCVSDETCV